MMDSKQSFKVTTVAEVTQESIAVLADYLTITISAFAALKNPAVAVVMGITIRQLVRMAFLKWPQLFATGLISNFISFLKDAKSSKKTGQA